MFFRELDQRKQFSPSLYILKHLHKSQLSKHCNVYFFFFFLFFRRNKIHLRSTVTVFAIINHPISTGAISATQCLSFQWPSWKVCFLSPWQQLKNFSIQHCMCIANIYYCFSHLFVGKIYSLAKLRWPVEDTKSRPAKMKWVKTKIGQQNTKIMFLWRLIEKSVKSIFGSIS